MFIYLFMHNILHVSMHVCLYKRMCMYAYIHACIYHNLCMSVGRYVCVYVLQSVYMYEVCLFTMVCTHECK